MEQIRAAGGNPFIKYQVPEAILKFRQGVGRLIRSHEDRGIVVILDPRVRSKSYGRWFLEALPDLLPVGLPAEPSKYLLSLSFPETGTGYGLILTW